MKDLYTKAWDDWVLYWEQGGIGASYLIETAVIDDFHYCDVRVHVRKQMLVHKFSGQTEDLMWQHGVMELLKAGTMKVYEGIVELKRKEYYREQLDGDRLYPMTLNDI